MGDTNVRRPVATCFEYGVDFGLLVHKSPFMADKIHWCLAHSTFFAEKWRNIFQFSSIPTEYRHGPYQRRLKSCFKGWSLVRPSVSLRHMHQCMSMNALEQGLLGLEAAKASDIDDFV